VTVWYHSNTPQGLEGVALTDTREKRAVLPGLEKRRENPGWEKGKEKGTDQVGTSGVVFEGTCKVRDARIEEGM